MESAHFVLPLFPRCPDAQTIQKLVEVLAQAV